MSPLNIFLFTKLLMHRLHPEFRDMASDEKAFDFLKEIAEGRATVISSLEKSISLASKDKQDGLRAFVQETQPKVIEAHRAIAQEILDELQRRV